MFTGKTTVRFGKSWAPQRGAVTAEFVLLMPLLLTLFFLIFEVGRVFGSWLLIANASREAARYGATGAWSAHQCGGPGGTGGCTAIDTDIRTRAATTARFLVVGSNWCGSTNQPPSGSTSCVTVCQDTFADTTCAPADVTSDHRVTVLVVYQVHTLMRITPNFYIPFLGRINYPGYMTVSGHSVVRAER